MDYTIQPGDTLGALAQRFGTTVQALAQANGIANPNMIRAGATLRVPGGEGAAPQAAARPAGAPAPTTGAMPRPRPQQVAAMDPMAAPLPRQNPSRPEPPLPRPNVARPGGAQANSLMANLELENALARQQQEMQQQRMSGPADPTLGTIPQPAQPAPQAPAAPPAPPAAPAAPNVMATFLPNGLSDLPTLNQNRFNELRLMVYSDPSLRNDPRFMSVIDAEAQRRVQMLQLDLDRLNRSSGARDMREAAWQNAGQQMPRSQGPQQPPIAGNPANPMPQGQQMSGVPLDPYGPAQQQGWEDRYMAGQPSAPQLDPVAELIRQLRSGSGTNQVPNHALARQLQQGMV